MDATAEQPRGSWATVFRTFFSLLGKERAGFFALTISLFCIYLYNLVPPFLLGKIVDFFIGYRPGGSLSLFYIYVGILGASHVIVSLIRLWLKQRLSEHGIALKRRARAFSFDRLLHSPATEQLEEGTGNKVERINAGSEALDTLLDLMANNVFDVVSAFAGVILIFAFLDPIFVPFLIAYAIVYSLIQFFFNRKIIMLKREINAAQQAVSGIYVEGIGNAMTLKAMGAEDRLSGEIRGYETNSQKLEFQKTILGTRKWYLFQTLNGVFLALFLLIVGRGVLAGAMTVGAILTYYSYFSKVKDATEDGNKLVDKLINRKVDVENMIPLWGKRFFSGTRPFPERWDVVRIKDATLKYPTGQRGLNEAAIEIRRGEVVGITGPSGGGKSSLLKVLVGLYPLTSGEYLIGTVPAGDIKHERLVAHFSVVPQETELFHFSLRDNITLMRDDDRRRLHHAIKLAHLAEVVKKLPQGLDTPLGEHAHKLSGGERQRIGIARAVYKDAPIMVFDEATSALDQATEKAIMKGLFSEYRGKKTFIIVAHQPAALAGADRLFVVRGGRVSDNGPVAGKTIIRRRKAAIVET